MIRKLIGNLERLGVKPNDPEDVKQGKNIIVGASIASSTAALVWGLIYISQGENISGSILLFGGIIYYLYLPIFSRTGNIASLKTLTFTIWLVVPTSAMWFLGGFYPSSNMIIWSFIALQRCGF